ncbi:MAG: pimeloyl-ACP methyl ester carboxylesterase [Bradymonadia bacterium]|jgi:pimeloyl-ACP methyl ester carboxylesterase
MSRAGDAPSNKELRSEDQRWALQHEFLAQDPSTGVDPVVLAQVHPAPTASHVMQTPDGTTLVYKAIGETSQPPVMFCNGLGGTYRTFAEVFGGLVPEYRVLCHDYRGLFESGRPPDNHSLDVPTHADDLFRVMDHAGVDEAILFGWSMGVQVALEAYRQHPERVRAMVFASGVDGRLLDSVEFVPGASKLALAGVRLMQKSGGDVANALSRVVRSRSVERLARKLNLVGRNSAVTLKHASLLLSSDPAIYWRIVERLHEHSAAAWLKEIDVPVLILHGDSDVLTPVRRGTEMLAQIPNSEMRVFTGCTHAVVLEFPDRVVKNMCEFLQRRLPVCD